MENEGQEPEGGDEGQEPEVSGGTGGDGEGQGGNEEQTFSAAYVARLRKENAGHRTKLKTLEADLKALKDKDLSEQQKLQEEIKRLSEETAKREVRVRQADLIAAAVELGASKPKLVAKLVEDDVEEADFAKAIRDIKKENPELFRAPGAPPGSGDGGAGGAGKPGKANMNDWMRKAAGYGE